MAQQWGKAAHFGYSWQLRTPEDNVAQRQALENTQGWLTSCKTWELQWRNTKRAEHLCSQKGKSGAGPDWTSTWPNPVPLLSSLVFLWQRSTGILKEHFSSADSVLLNHLQVVLNLRKFVPTQVTLHLSTLNSICYFITAIHFGNLFFTFSICCISFQYFNFDGSAIVKSSAARCSLGSFIVGKCIFKKCSFCMVIISWPYWCAIRGIVSMPFASWSSSILTACLTASSFSSLLPKHWEAHRHQLFLCLLTHFV